MASIRKTAMNIAPSSQSDSPSIVMLRAMKMEMVSATSSSRVKSKSIGVGKKRLASTRAGATKRAIWVAAPMTLLDREVHLVLASEDDGIHYAGDVAHRGQQDDACEDLVDAQLPGCRLKHIGEDLAHDREYQGRGCQQSQCCIFHEWVFTTSSSAG